MKFGFLIWKLSKFVFLNVSGIKIEELFYMRELVLNEIFGNLKDIIILEFF